MTKLLRNVRGFGFLLVFASGAAVMTMNNGCSKSSNNSTKPAADTVSSAAVASALQGLVSNSSSGIAPQTESNAQMMATTSMTCGQVIDTTLAGSYNDTNMTWNFKYVTSDTCSCISGVVSSVVMNFSGYTDMKMQTTGTYGTNAYVGATMNMHVGMSGLNTPTGNFALTESCSAKDTIKETSPTAETAYFDINYSTSNLAISKSTYQIVSGTATMQYTILTSNGTSYNQTATMNFIGNRQAVLTLSNGYSTTLSW